MIEIPQQLKRSEFRFFPLQEKSKHPIETSWQEKNNYAFDDKKLLEYLDGGCNYAVLGGCGNLIFIDADCEEIDNIVKANLPETFTINTSRYCKNHYYYITDKKIKGIRLSKDKVGDLGDVRSAGQYVVGPNSIHPSGKIYSVSKDIPIANITEEKIREVFKDYIDSKSSGFREFPIVTTKRSSDYVRNCLMPDFCLNNKLKGETSKNWKLFPYLVDILHNREVAQTVYEHLAKIQGHDMDAIKGWYNYAMEGKLAKGSCEKMQEYIKRFHPDLLKDTCEKCILYKKQQDIKESNNEYMVEMFNSFTNYLEIAEKFVKEHPLFYDNAKNWWIWDKENRCYAIKDEIDIMNALDAKTKNPSVNAKIKNEIIEALKRIGRKHKPKNFKKTWIQFKDKIVDISNDNIFEATPEYFACNPIPFKMGDYEETPILDRLFKEWVGEKYARTLYEIVAFCLLCDYPIHRVFCFYGSGLNGKGSFMRFLKKFIGVENCASTELDSLLMSRFEVARLHKKLVCMMSETNFEEMSKTSMLKKLTGQDLIGYEYKNKDLFEDMNYSKILISTNNLPPTTDKTIGFYRRWLIIDFPNMFDEGKNIEDSIPDFEFENLAKKSVKILKEVLAYGKFTSEGTIAERAKKYEDLSNPFDKFLIDNIEEDAVMSIGKNEFKKRLESWCKENKFRVISDGTIAMKMKEMKIYDGRKDFYAENGERIRYWAWLGVKWRTERKAIISEKNKIDEKVSEKYGPFDALDEKVSEKGEVDELSKNLKICENDNFDEKVSEKGDKNENIGHFGQPGQTGLPILCSNIYARIEHRNTGPPGPGGPFVKNDENALYFSQDGNITKITTQQQVVKQDMDNLTIQEKENNVMPSPARPAIDAGATDSEKDDDIKITEIDFDE